MYFPTGSLARFSKRNYLSPQARNYSVQGSFLDLSMLNTHEQMQMQYQQTNQDPQNTLGFKKVNAKLSKRDLSKNEKSSQHSEIRRKQQTLKQNCPTYRSTNLKSQLFMTEKLDVEIDKHK